MTFKTISLTHRSPKDSSITVHLRPCIWAIESQGKANIKKLCIYMLITEKYVKQLQSLTGMQADRPLQSSRQTNPSAQLSSFGQACNPSSAPTYYHPSAAKLAESLSGWSISLCSQHVYVKLSCPASGVWRINLLLYQLTFCNLKTRVTLSFYTFNGHITLTFDAIFKHSVG